MTTLTRSQYAEAVLAQLRGVGPQTVAQIQGDLAMRKRDVESALYLLAGVGKIEYDHPITSPLRYKATA